VEVLGTKRNDNKYLLEAADNSSTNYKGTIFHSVMFFVRKVEEFYLFALVFIFI